MITSNLTDQDNYADEWDDYDPSDVPTSPVITQQIPATDIIPALQAALARQGIPHKTGEKGIGAGTGYQKLSHITVQSTSVAVGTTTVYVGRFVGSRKIYLTAQYPLPITQATLTTLLDTLVAAHAGTQVVDTGPIPASNVMATIKAELTKRGQGYRVDKRAGGEYVRVGWDNAVVASRDTVYVGRFQKTGGLVYGCGPATKFGYTAKYTTPLTRVDLDTILGALTA